MATPEKDYEDIEIDLDKDIIMSLMGAYVFRNLRGASVSYFDDLLTKLKEKPVEEIDPDAMFEAFGRSIFNHILIDAIMERIANDNELMDAVSSFKEEDAENVDKP